MNASDSNSNRGPDLTQPPLAGQQAAGSGSPARGEQPKLMKDTTPGAVSQANESSQLLLHVTTECRASIEDLHASSCFSTVGTPLYLLSFHSQGHGEERTSPLSPRGQDVEETGSHP
jgi:hypothetical protein